MVEVDKVKRNLLKIGTVGVVLTFGTAVVSSKIVIQPPTVGASSPAPSSNSVKTAPSSQKSGNAPSDSQDWQRIFSNFDLNNFRNLCCPDIEDCDEKTGKFYSRKRAIVLDSAIHQLDIPDILDQTLNPLLLTYDSMASNVGKEVAGGFRSAIIATIKDIKDYKGAIDTFLAANARDFSQVDNEYHIPGRRRGYEDRRNWNNPICPNDRFWMLTPLEELQRMQSRDLTPADLKSLTDDQVATYQKIKTNLSSVNPDFASKWDSIHTGLAANATDEMKQVEVFMANAKGWEDKISADLSKLMGLGRVTGLDYVSKLGIRSGSLNTGGYADKYHDEVEYALKFDWPHMSVYDGVVTAWNRVNSMLDTKVDTVNCAQTISQLFSHSPAVASGVTYHNFLETVLDRMGLAPEFIDNQRPKRTLLTYLEIKDKGKYVIGWDKMLTVDQVLDVAPEIFTGYYDFSRPWLDASFPSRIKSFEQNVVQEPQISMASAYTPFALNYQPMEKPISSGGIL